MHDRSIMIHSIAFRMMSKTPEYPSYLPEAANTVSFLHMLELLHFDFISSLPKYLFVLCNAISHDMHESAPDYFSYFVG